MADWPARRPHPPQDPAPLWAELADLAGDVACDAGRMVMEMAQSARTSTSTKSSATDLVTAADTAAEKLIVRGVLSVRPDDGIEGEEGSTRPGSSGVVWHIDPIDGTTNYVYDLPAFTVSVAAAIDDVVVAGVVFDPSHDLLYRAVKGGGASCNGVPLQCSSLDQLSTALVATGFSYQAGRRRQQAEVLVGVLPRIRDIRRFGSAAFDLCAVAAGRVDAYYEQGLNRWDLAAGALLASEAGARVENLREGEPDKSFVLAAPPALFEVLRDLLVDQRADSPA